MATGPVSVVHADRSYQSPSREAAGRVALAVQCARCVPDRGSGRGNQRSSTGKTVRPVSSHEAGHDVIEADLQGGSPPAAAARRLARNPG
jgi:hypothetical protein